MPARQLHNSRQLKCPHGCKKWFKTTSGRTRHIRSFHDAKAAMHRSHHSLNLDEAPIVQSSPLPDDAIYYASPRNSQHSQHTPPHSDVPMFDDPLQVFNVDPPLNEPFEDVPFAQSPARNKSPSPSQDEIRIYHPLINGAYYTVIIFLGPMLMMRHARTAL